MKLLTHIEKAEWPFLILPLMLWLPYLSYSLESISNFQGSPLLPLYAKYFVYIPAIIQMTIGLSGLAGIILILAKRKAGLLLFILAAFATLTSLTSVVLKTLKNTNLTEIFWISFFTTVIILFMRESVRNKYEVKLLPLILTLFPALLPGFLLFDLTQTSMTLIAIFH